MLVGNLECHTSFRDHHRRESHMSANRSRFVARRTAVAGLILSAVFALPVWVQAAPVPADASKQELESLWADLIKTAKDEGDASRALLKLSKHRDVVPFLKGKLKPLQISP